MTAQQRYRYDPNNEPDAEDARRASLEEEFRNTIEEARMVLPGLQALFGFQLIAVFSSGFHDLSASSVKVHLGSLLLIAFSLALILTTAAYHRVAEQGWISRSFCVLASRFTAWAMLALAVGLCLEIYVVALASTDNLQAALTFALSAALVFGGLWLIFPFVGRMSRRKPQNKMRDIGGVRTSVR